MRAPVISGVCITQQNQGVNFPPSLSSLDAAHQTLSARILMSELVMQRRVAHLEHLEHYLRLTWLPRVALQCGSCSLTLEVPWLLPAFQDCSCAFHFLSSQPPQLLNACRLLFNVESVCAACNQKHSLIARDFGPQFTDQEVQFWVVT